MLFLVYLISYIGIIVFVAAVVYKIVMYLKKPIHVRWELYPVAHEGKRASYGGSYLEDTDWWNKKRTISKIGELKVMIPEILFLKAVKENNPKLWYLTYPFHLGLYLICLFVVFVLAGAVWPLICTIPIGSTVCGSPIVAITNIIGPLGFILCLFGSITLLYKRATDPGMKNYSSFSHYFNLVAFALLMIVSIITWLFIDPDFNLMRLFVKNLISFNFVSLQSSFFTFQAILFFLLLAYIPLTHMAHFFMKYFLYHDIRWGDEPNINTPETDKKIGIVLNYPVSWGAPHIDGQGTKTWAEVATFNPAQEDSDKK